MLPALPCARAGSRPCPFRLSLPVKEQQLLGYHFPLSGSFSFHAGGKDRHRPYSRKRSAMPWPPAQSSIMPSPEMGRPHLHCGLGRHRQPGHSKPRTEKSTFVYVARAKCMTPLSSQREKCLLGNELRKGEKHDPCGTRPDPSRFRSVL